MKCGKLWGAIRHCEDALYEKALRDQPTRPACDNKFRIPPDAEEATRIEPARVLGNHIKRLGELCQARQIWQIMFGYDEFRRRRARGAGVHSLPWELQDDEVM